MNQLSPEAVAAALREAASRLPDDPRGPGRIAAGVTRARRRRAAGAVIGVVIVVAAASLGLVTSLNGSSTRIIPSISNKVIRGGDLQQAIYISSYVVFAPPPAGAVAKISAKKAYNDFRDTGSRTRPPQLLPGMHYKHGRYSGFPREASYQLGLLFGSGELDWGLHFGPFKCASDSHRQCSEWLFFNARSGRMDLGTGPGPSVLKPDPNLSAPIPAGPVANAPLSLIATPSGTLRDLSPAYRLLWTMSDGNCSVKYHWFNAVGNGTVVPTQSCPRGRFAASSATDVATRGNLFTVVGGHGVKPRRVVVFIKLADGIRYQAGGGKNWFTVIQRCGDVAGTKPVEAQLVQLVGPDGGNLMTDPIVKTIPIRAGDQSVNATDACTS